MTKSERRQGLHSKDECSKFLSSSPHHRSINQVLHHRLNLFIVASIRSCTFNQNSSTWCLSDAAIPNKPVQLGKPRRSSNQPHIKVHGLVSACCCLKFHQHHSLLLSSSRTPYHPPITFLHHLPSLSSIIFHYSLSTV